MIAIADQVIVDDELDNRELVAVLWKRRLLITVCAVLLTGVMTVLAFIMTPVYRGTAIMVPVNTDRSALGGGLDSALGGVGGLAALAGLNLSSKESAVEETLAVLKSRQFTENFIVRNNLMPQLFADKWDASRGNWKVGEKAPTLHKAFKSFSGMRSVNKDPKTGLITLTVDWTDRVKAATWTNMLVEQLNEEMRNRAMLAANASLGFLQQELTQTTEVGTREAVSRLIESQVKQKMLANVTQEYSLRFVDRAMPSDMTDKVAPRKSLMMAGGMLLGIVIGSGLALLLNARQLAVRRKRT